MTISRVSFPTVFVLLITALVALPLLAPVAQQAAHLALSSAATTAEVEDVMTDVWLASGRHTDPSHNPNVTGTSARTLITGLVTAWEEILRGSGPEHRCGAILDSTGAIFRLAIWIADATRPGGGYVTSIDPNNFLAPYVSSYDVSKDQFLGGPGKKKLDQSNRTWSASIGCPGAKLPALQPASR